MLVRNVPMKIPVTGISGGLKQQPHNNEIGITYAFRGQLMTRCERLKTRAHAACVFNRFRLLLNSPYKRIESPAIWRKRLRQAWALSARAVNRGQSDNQSKQEYSEVSFRKVIHFVCNQSDCNGFLEAQQL